MLMQKDENALLETWLLYYEWLVGADNIFIWDNGSSSEASINHLRMAEKRGVNVVWNKNTAQDYEKKNAYVGRLIEDLSADERYNFFLPLDCDEFLAVKQGTETTCDRQSILDTFEKYKDADGPLKISGSYYNIPTRDHKFFFWRESKVMFRSGTFASTDHGFHHGSTVSGSPEVETDFVHLHFQHKPLSTLIRHARNKLSLRVKDFSTENLVDYNGPGSHLVKYFTMTEQDYRRSFDIGSAVSIPAFEATLKTLGALYPFDGEFSEFV